MTIRYAHAPALAFALLLLAAPASAQNLASGKVNTGTPTFSNDQNVPLQLDATGALKVTGGSGGGGSSTVTGSMEQDVRATGTLNAATLNAAITTPINGQGTVGYTFTGLTASGATLTYEQSIDGGTTWTGINAVNRGTGVPEATRTTDGQIALSATGRTTIRARVSTAGTGTVTVATNVSVREGIFSLGSPLPPGANAIGAVTQGTNPWAVSANAIANASGNPIFVQMTNPTATGSVAAAGTNGTQAQAVQGITNGVPQNVANGGAFAVQNTAATPAGTNTVGNTVPAASAANIGIAPAFTAGGTSLVGKAAPGNLYGFSVTAGATAGFLAIINASAVPTAGAGIVPLECVPVAANQYFGRRQDIPDRYTVGIVAVFSSSCTTYTAVAPQVVSLIVQ